MRHRLANRQKPRHKTACVLSTYRATQICSLTSDSLRNLSVSAGCESLESLRAPASSEVLASPLRWDELPTCTTLQPQRPRAGLPGVFTVHLVDFRLPVGGVRCSHPLQAGTAACRPWHPPGGGTRAAPQARRHIPWKVDLGAVEGERLDLVRPSLAAARSAMRAERTRPF